MSVFVHEMLESDRDDLESLAYRCGYPKEYSDVAALDWTLSSFPPHSFVAVNDGGLCARAALRGFNDDPSLPA